MGGAQMGIEVVASGAGLMILPMSVARLYNRKDVVYRTVTGQPETQIGLAWLAERNGLRHRGVHRDCPGPHGAQFAPAIGAGTAGQKHGPQNLQELQKHCPE